ncbi:MAG: hypothetical protein Q8K60_08065 [Parachlamydiaceae bacterium]|nr:hypothetical protein [Parachlamydiaceae bacterium]
MEGPSLFLAAEQLSPFVKQKIKQVEGNTKIGKERLLEKKILSIFSFGKTLIFQFDTFALRVHFLLWGSFEATIDGQNVNGDYKRKNRVPRLMLQLENGLIIFYACSLKWIEDSQIVKSCDFSIDIMSTQWDEKKCLLQLKKYPESEISDVLLDQSIFAGVGNIIRNEVLFREKILPFHKIKKLSNKKLKQIICETRSYVFQFYQWRKEFVLKKHYEVYRKSCCSQCQEKITKKKTGQRKRISFYCLNCQK